MVKRLHAYFSEMFPIIPRFVLGIIVFFEIYFIILLNYHATGSLDSSFDLTIGIQEFVGAYTIFAFLMWLRVADDFKDYELDKRLFAHRPLPSGRVTKKDLIIICTLVQGIALILNLIFMPKFHRIFFGILYFYGFLMSKWFFQKAKIQPNLPLALVTHNPVQMFINLYIISFTVIKYNLDIFSNIQIIVLVLLTLYFPALIWEIARKIKAPKDENDYVTYSKLFGYKRVIRFIAILTLVDILTNFVLVWNLNKITIIILVLLVSWMMYTFADFVKDPTRYKIVKKVELYTYLQETIMLVTIGVYLIKDYGLNIF